MVSSSHGRAKPMKPLFCHHVTVHCPGFMNIEDPSLPLSPDERTIYHRFLGYERIASMSHKSMVDQLEYLLIKSLNERQQSAANIALLIHVHTHQEASPYKRPHLIELQQRIPGLHCPCFGISIHNCVSFFTAMKLIQSYLSQRHRADAVILAGDMVHTPFQRIMPRTAIMGECMTATWLSQMDCAHQLLSIAQHTHGQYAHSMHQACDPTQDFDGHYPQHLKAVIEDCLRQAKLSSNDIDLILPHNVSLFSWQRFATFMGLKENLIFLKNIARYGHCFNADPTLNWSSVDFHSQLPNGGHYLMVGVGLGATFAAAAWRYKP